MPIVNPYIKNPDHIKWLEDNEESFLDWMAKHHSLKDIAHTILHIDSLDDKYIANLIKQTEASMKKELKEKRARKRKLEGKTVTDDSKATAIEKKQAMIEEAVNAKQKAAAADDDLLD